MTTNIKRRTVSVLLIAALLLASLPVLVFASANSTFTDVKTGDWFYDDVMWAYGKGYVKGCGNDSYEPQSRLTEAAMLTILYRVAGEPEFENKVDFGDQFETVDGEFAHAKASWFYTAFCWAGTIGIIDAGTGAAACRRLVGCNASPLSRAALAKMIGDYAKALNVRLPDKHEFKGLQDIKEGAWYYSDAVSLYKAGIMMGVSETSFAPDKPTTRAEAAAVIRRLSDAAPNIA